MYLKNNESGASRLHILMPSCSHPHWHIPGIFLSEWGLFPNERLFGSKKSQALITIFLDPASKVQRFKREPLLCCKPGNYDKNANTAIWNMRGKKGGGTNPQIHRGDAFYQARQSSAKSQQVFSFKNC